MLSSHTHTPILLEKYHLLLTQYLPSNSVFYFYFFSPTKPTPYLFLFFFSPTKPTPLLFSIYTNIKKKIIAVRKYYNIYCCLMFISILHLYTLCKPYIVYIKDNLLILTYIINQLYEVKYLPFNVTKTLDYHCHILL